MEINATLPVTYNGPVLTDCVMDACADPRAINWLLMPSAWPTIILSALYILFVVWIGPMIMKNREPIYPKNAILFYNAFQVVFSFWMAYEIGSIGWFSKYKLFCEPISYTNDSDTLQLVNVAWWFFFSKFTEFFDTIFMVIRKKNKNISALHVIHHGIMPYSAWLMAKYTPTGHSTLVMMINPFIHFVMYSYYFIAALGPNFQKYIWWKKYLTLLQMGQFVTCLLHALSAFYFQCDYPKIPIYIVISHSLLFFIMFTDFFIRDKKQRSQCKTSSGKRAYDVKSSTKIE